MSSLSNIRLGKTLRVAIATLALGTAGFATSLSTASDAAAWDGPKNIVNKGKGGGGGGGGAWKPKGPKGGYHGHGHGHGHGKWGKGWGPGYGYGAGLVLGATLPLVMAAPACRSYYETAYVPGVGKVREKVTICD